MSLPNDFPTGVSDADLDTLLSTMLSGAHGWSANFENILPELQLSLIQAGLQEQQRRETERLRTTVQITADAADRAARMSLIVSIAALVVSAVGLP